MKIEKKAKGKGKGKGKAIIGIVMTAIMVASVMTAMIGSTGAYSVGRPYNIIKKDMGAEVQSVIIGQDFFTNWGSNESDIVTIYRAKNPGVELWAKKAGSDNTLTIASDDWRKDGAYYVYNATGPAENPRIGDYDTVDIIASEKRVDFDFLGRVVIGEKITIRGTATSGTYISVYVDDVLYIWLQDLVIEDGEFSKEVTTTWVGMNVPRTVRLKAWIDCRDVCPRCYVPPGKLCTSVRPTTTPDGSTKVFMVPSLEVDKTENKEAAEHGLQALEKGRPYFQTFDFLIGTVEVISGVKTISALAAISAGVKKLTAKGIFDLVTGQVAGEISSELQFKKAMWLYEQYHTCLTNIKNDPPDMNYTEVVEIEPFDILSPTGNTTFDTALNNVFNVLAEQNAISKALLTSIERYDGALQANESKYMILQGNAIQNYSDMLTSNLERYNQSLTNLSNETEMIKSDKNISTNLSALQQRLSTHRFTEEEIKYFKDMGANDTEIETFKQMIIDVNLTDFGCTVKELQSAVNDSIPAYTNLADQATNIIEILERYSVDLAILASDISFSNPNPIDGECITINATVHNIGDHNTTHVTVLFFDGDPNENETEMFGDREINSINANTNVTVNATWNTTGKVGDNVIWVWVYATEELNIDDNQAKKPIYVRFDNQSFDTRLGTYPSIMGTHNGTIKPSHKVNASKMYTYPCMGTGGHSEYVKFRNESWNITASWNGYQGDYHNITFDESFTLYAELTYNYTICTGSYPQIHHNRTLIVPDGEITCTEFTDANGKKYNNWIPAIRLE